MFMKVYCYECDKDVNVIIKEKNINMCIKGVEFSFVGNIAYCEECNNEVYLSELDDENIKKGNEVYRGKTGIIKVQEINNLLQKYNIGKEPLSDLLGWGHKTINRYCTGLMPSKEYSDRLKELSNPYKMYELFQSRKEVLTEVAAKKLETSIQKAIELSLEDTKINNIRSISKYLLNQYGYSINIDELDGNSEVKWLIRVPELDGCASFGKTLEEAFSNLNSSIESWINSIKKQGKALPKNRIRRVEEEYEGNLTFSIPKRLYHDLVLKSEEDRLSLNEYLIFLLTKGLYDNEITTTSWFNLTSVWPKDDKDWEPTDNSKIFSFSNRKLVLKGAEF